MKSQEPLQLPRGGNVPADFIQAPQGHGYDVPKSGRLLIEQVTGLLSQLERTPCLVQGLATLLEGMATAFMSGLKQDFLLFSGCLQ